MLQSNVAKGRRFQLVLIKPSHYDDDGYVIRWWRAMTPSNSLAAVYGIAADCAERQVLGPDVAIDIQVIDETNTRVESLRDFPGRPASSDVSLLLRSIKSISARSTSRSLRVPELPWPWGLSCAGMPVDAGWPRGGSRRLPGHGVTIFAGEAEGRARI